MMSKEYLIQSIKEWNDQYDYPFRNQEDLVECRTDWETLKDAALSAYYKLSELKEYLESIEEIIN